jgi:hypothetical protein
MLKFDEENIDIGIGRQIIQFESRDFDRSNIKAAPAELQRLLTGQDRFPKCVLWARKSDDRSISAFRSLALDPGTSIVVGIV